MNLHQCPDCGATLGVPEGQAVVRCRGCGLTVDLGRVDEGKAVADLLASVESNSDLPGKLRFKLGRVLREHLSELDAEAIAAAGPPEPEKPAPPPLAPFPIDLEQTPTKELLEELEPDERPEATPAAAPSPDAPGPAKPREPSLWSRLGPAFTENILFALAAFLLVAGAVYFVTTAWTTMTGEQRLLVVVGGLELLGGVLYAAGRVLNRGGSLPEVERVLLIVVCFMVPVAAAAAGELLTVTLLTGLAASLAVLGPGYLLARDLRRVSDPALLPVLPPALIALTLLVLLAPTGEDRPTMATVAGTLALVLASRALIRSMLPRLGENLNPALWSTLLLAFVAIVFTGTVSHAAWRHGLPPGKSLPPLGILFSGLSVIAVMLEGALARAGRFESGRSPTLLAGALGLAATGVVVALAHEQSLLAAALLGAAGALVAGYRLPAPALLLPGLVLAGLAYLKLPAPVREFATMVRDEAAEALGYRPERLPFAYYGVTFLPYVALSGLWGAVLTRIGRSRRAQVVLWWTLLVALGLCAQAMLMCRGDLRAPAAVFFAEGAMLLLLARYLRDRFFVGAGIALVYAGLSFLLHRLEVVTAVHLIAMALAGLGVLFVARRFKSTGDAFHRTVADTLTDLTAVMAVAVVAIVVATGTIAKAPPGALDVPAALLLGFLLTVLGVIYQRPEGALLATLLLALGLTGAMNAVDLEPWGVWRALVFAAGSALPLLIYGAVPRIPDRRKLLAEFEPTLLVPLGILLLQVFGAAQIGLAEVHGSHSVASAAGLVVGAAVLVLTALVSRQAWVSVAAVMQVFVTGPVLTGAMGHRMPCAAAALAAAIGLAATGGGALLAARRQRTRDLIAPIVSRSITPLAGVLLLWLGVLLLHPEYRNSTGYDGAHLAVAALIATVVTRLSRRPEGLVVAGLMLPLVAIGFLDQMAARIDLYPLALLLAAGVTTVWSNHLQIGFATTLFNLILAFIVATILAFADLGSPGVLFLTFAVLAVAGRLIARAQPIAGSLVMVLSALIGVPLVFFGRGVKIDLEWQPFILLLFSAATLLAPRIEAVRLDRRVSRAVAIPFVAAAGAAFLMFGCGVLAKEPSTSRLFGFNLPCLVFTALAFAGAVAALGKGGGVLRPVALVLALFVCAPVNIAIAGGYERFWRPDVETALVGALLALFMKVESDRREFTPYWFAGFALLLTVGDLRHLSTPLTVLVATAAAGVLLVRTGRRVHADLASNGLIAAAFAFVTYAVPESGRPLPELLTILAATAAAMLLGLLVAARRLAAVPDRSWAAIAAIRCRRAAVHAAGLAILCALGNLLFMHARPAEADLVLMIVFALVTVAVVAVRAALSTGPVHLVHAATAALLTLYAFVALRTGALDLLEGFHLHTVAVIGAGLLALARGRLREALTIEGLILPIPVVLASASALAGIDGSVGRAASGFFIAAAAAGLGAQRLRRSALWGVAGVLLNLAIYSIWRYRGIVDPAFYGVPPGLSFLVAAEFLRKRVSPAAHLQMFLLGSVLLYGSVGVQVLRVEEPTHALVLFALGIVTVVLGFVMDRREFLVAGTSVVVLDVVAYLARHGFEEGFLGSALLILAGLTVLTVATLSTLRRKRDERSRNEGN